MPILCLLFFLGIVFSLVLFTKRLGKPPSDEGGVNAIDGGRDLQGKSFLNNLVNC